MRSYAGALRQGGAAVGDDGCHGDSCGATCPRNAAACREGSDRVQSPGFEPGSPTWQAGIITKLYYDCLVARNRAIY